jgi:NADH-quinone oxidoreductase subunit J
LQVTPEILLFCFLAAVAVTTGVLMILQRNPVMSAICLIGNFFALAALYLLLQAQFLAVLQIIVYTGAIMVLVVFVIMLLNLGDDRGLAEKASLRSSAGAVLAAGLLLELVVIIVLRALPGLPRATAAQSASIGTVGAMGAALFGRFLLPFEVTSLVLLAAIVGAVILAKKRL